MKGIVVYKTKYGSTREYAQWISEESGFPLYSVRQRPGRILADSDIVILGSPIRIGRLKIAPWMKRRWQMLRQKKLVVFSVSAALPDDPSVHDAWRQSLTEDIRAVCTCFSLPGRLVFDKLTPIDKLLMHGGARMERDPQVREGMLKGIDNVERRLIEPIVRHIRSLLT
jgi:menaquinone-dependent protoporphyrinogen IX oxidase